MFDVLHTGQGDIQTEKRNPVVRIVCGRASQLIEYSVIYLIDRSRSVISFLYTTYFKR